MKLMISRITIWSDNEKEIKRNVLPTHYLDESSFVILIKKL
jgi:hypothetical protein